MDLRKCRKKRIDAAKVLNYEYSYYSYSGSEYGQPCLCIIIERNEETVSSPGYELMIKLDQSGIITEIMRLKKIFGAGSLIKKFPASVEEKAETILDDIITPASAADSHNLALLHDKYGIVK